MSNKTRKRFLPVALVMAVAAIAVMALAIAMAGGSRDVQAHGNSPGSCDSDAARAVHDLISPNDPCPTPVTPPVVDPGNGGNGDTGMGDMLKSSSTSASATVELKLTIDSLPSNAVAGSSVEIYLEDDFQVPDSIDRGDVYFIATGPSTDATNDGGRVYATDPVELNQGEWFGSGSQADDPSIQVFIPDMNTGDNFDGFNGPTEGQTLTVVITKAAGIKNPSEAGTHSVGYSWLGATDEPDKAPVYSTYKAFAKDSAEAMAAQGDNDEVTLGMHNSVSGDAADVGLKTLAKIVLSDEDNTRGYELTVTGSGFNNGTTASAYVLHSTSATAPTCEEIIDNGTNVGGETVGSDDKAAVTFEVTVPTFMAGNNNYICMEDGEGRMSDKDVEQFKLEPSIRVVPTEANAGDTVNVFGQDYPSSATGFDYVTIANKDVGGRSTGPYSATFTVPGGLKGTLRVDASWGGMKEDAKITINPSSLTLSKEEVSANESITIRGSGFGDGSGCLVSATISGAELVLISDDDPTKPRTLDDDESCIEVEVSSAGQFAATVAIWSDGATNPALTPGTHTIEVMDDEEFTGTATITIKEPTLTVTPDVAGPRDFITISGANWPVENDDGGNIGEVQIEIGNGDDDEDADPDASGRWSVQYRVGRDVTIPSTVQVKATYGESNNIVKIGSFSVPAANLVVEPMVAAPGDTITLTASGFAVFESDIEVKIGSVTVNVPDGTFTDRDGGIEALEVIVPGLDPALYTVQLKVEDTVTIGELTVQDDSVAGATTALPGAVSDLGDNLDAIFYFNNTNKAWTFFDPRPEFAELNTLSELVGGQPYWVLVKETQEDVMWNTGRTDFTCAADDCWNLKIW